MRWILIWQIRMELGMIVGEIWKWCCLQSTRWLNRWKAHRDLMWKWNANKIEFGDRNEGVFMQKVRFFNPKSILSSINCEKQVIIESFTWTKKIEKSTNFSLIEQHGYRWCTLCKCVAARVTLSACVTATPLHPTSTLQPLILVS